jgi:Ca-activated chloride channel family protein
MHPKTLGELRRAAARQVAEVCHGQAYFTTPRMLGRYVLVDYLNRKTRTVH